jgi:hypothetical protein
VVVPPAPTTVELRFVPVGLIPGVILLGLAVAGLALAARSRLRTR